MSMIPHRIKLRAWNIWRHKRWDVPDGIGFETSTACNRSCSYCPVSVWPKVKQQVVSDEMWGIFLYRLREFKWRGIVTFHLFNEPSLVAKSPQLVADIKALGCLPYMFSNGDRPDMVAKWCEAGAYRVRVTEHEPYREDWLPGIKRVADRYPKQVIIQRLWREMMNNHAGQVALEVKPMETCHAARAISISVNGQVGLCCEDADHEANFGNINTQSIQEIWDSPAYRNARERTARGVSARGSVGRFCDACFGRDKRKNADPTGWDAATTQKSLSGLNQ